MHQIRINTQNFRAISNADIIIDGITVVAGENGCGKSTLSKLLYFFYKTALNYNTLVSRDLKFKLRDIERLIEIMISEMRNFSSRRNTIEEYQELKNLHKGLDNFKESDLKKWILFIKKIENYYYSQPSLFEDNFSVDSTLSKRLKFIVKDILTDNNIAIENNSLPFDDIIKLLTERFRDANDKIKMRPNLLFLEALKNVFSEGKLPDKFEVYEFDEKIVSISNNTLSIPYLIQNIIYIDTPMSVGVKDTQNEHWLDLNEILKSKSKNSFSELSEVISQEVIDGDVSLDDNQLAVADFTFKRSDNEIYNLLEVATGVKSFAIIQLLIKNGTLNNKTLLILDEPESHLHPQWIIEYARLIVLLNRNLGVKFFIATHNPDLVSAIRYISQKENIENKLNFYLAIKTQSKFNFDYKHLGINIDPIFESFNIALDRINQYGI